MSDMLLASQERLVAELETLNVRYLSRQTTVQAKKSRPPERLLADLIRQPNSRVRTACIAVLLAQPEMAQSIHAALLQLKPDEQLSMKLLYTAAVVLQKKYSEQIHPILADRWQWLPDLFSSELGLVTNQTPEEQLRALGAIHRQRTGVVLNWTGTYENVAQHLLRRWELDLLWNA